MSSGCTTCDGACCRAYVVHVSGRDAVTIARAQALAIEQFVEIVRQPSPAAGGFALGDQSDVYSLALRRRPDGSCGLLIDLLDGSGRCGVYVQRPLTCAVFPLQLHHGSIDIRDDVVCEPSGRRITSVDFSAARTLLVRNAYEWNVYDRIVGRWNAARAGTGATSAAAYFGFITRAYDRIDAALDEHAETTALAVDHWIDGIPDAAVAAARHTFEATLTTALQSLTLR
jgi:Fe-S-cluster containining protein